MIRMEWNKANFFDRKKVIDAVGEARAKVLAKAGAFVRRRAQTSMRRRPGSSKPGQPPYAHEGSLRRLMEFAYDDSTNTMLVGPLGRSGSDVPSLHEFGGSRTTRRARRVTVRGRDKKGQFNSRTQRIEAGTQVEYAPRPYMGPALERERKKFPALFKDSVVATAP